MFSRLVQNSCFVHLARGGQGDQASVIVRITRANRRSTGYFGAGQQLAVARPVTCPVEILRSTQRFNIMAATLST